MSVQVVRKTFMPVVPSLIIVPNSSMAYWKGEVQYWLDDNSEVVFYTGPPGARAQIASNELWLHPGALDGKVRGSVDYMKKRVPKPHIVVISMESMLQVCAARLMIHAGFEVDPSSFPSSFRSWCTFSETARTEML